jgi:predicted nucleic acid-binding protein
MIVLDTNAVSELMRAAPAPQVLEWFRTHAPATLHITAITSAEVLTGLALLPRGARRERLEAAARQMLEEDFAGRCLPFDALAAGQYPDIIVRRTRAGRPMASMDAQIAAIARSRGGAVATRNVGDFAGCGIEVVNPWGV